MKRFFVTLFVVGTAVTLMAAQGFAGEGKALSDNEMDSINAKGFEHGFFYKKGNEAKVSLSWGAQKYASAINIVNAAQSDVANQTNIMSATKGHHGHDGNNKEGNLHHGSKAATLYGLVQENKIYFSQNSECDCRSGKAKVKLSGYAQKGATAVNIVNAAQSRVANQTNVAAARGGLYVGGLYQSNKIMGSQGGLFRLQ